MDAPALLVRRLPGLVDYADCWQRMQDFTATRGDDTPDELWLLQHPSLFTQGQAGQAAHLLDPGDIPVLHTDRGGQVTWHGPGQLVAYLLFDLRRLGIGPRLLVERCEQAVVDTLASVGISAWPRSDAHGVYVGPATAPRKIASLGLRVRRGCSYHGLALNVDNALDAFARINPCGHAGLQMTRVRDEAPAAPALAELGERLAANLCRRFGHAAADAGRD